ncbi:SDR family NAD(P)-dependent oxidoreductase [Cupriavidus alkaliphilus]|uniref:SDR family NAD(P)-dependent oxidoreductase n=1 Tax=Cupriavidus alkaliphilus TaxID=942866 RepID=UPI00339D40B9
MEKAMESLSGKAALVIGAAGGIGAAIASTLADYGVKVLLTDVQEEKVAATANSIKGAAFSRQDVTSEADWEPVMAHAANALGGLDIVVNNAGIVVFSLLENLTLEQFQKVQRVCLEGAFLGTKWGIRAMRNRGGSIVNISSLSGIVGSVGMSAYCAAKGGVRLLTKAAALECAYLRNGIRVNSIHPAVVNGGFGDTVLSDLVSAGLAPDEDAAHHALAGHHPMSFGDPQDVADAVCYVVSTKWMNGAELVLDGGASAQ